MLSITEVRQSIATNVTRSRELRTAANAVRGIERHNIHLERRRLGADTRGRLLLLAYLRGRPYLTAERSCRCAVDVSMLALTLAGAVRGNPDSVTREVIAETFKANEAIEAWLAVPAPVATAVAA